MIHPIYYDGFVKQCKKNPKIKVIPTLETLEDLGCHISSMFFLVDRNGAQYKPSVFDPSILPDLLQKHFTEARKNTVVFADETENVPAVDTEDIAEIVKPVPDNKAEDETETKICESCGETKELQHFKRKRGRGKNYHDECIECETKEAEAEIVEEAEPSNAAPTPSIKDNLTVATPANNTGTKPTKFISIEKAKLLVVEAYKIGVSEGKQEVICNDDISVHDLLELEA